MAYYTRADAVLLGLRGDSSPKREVVSRWQSMSTVMSNTTTKLFCMPDKTSWLQPEKMHPNFILCQHKMPLGKTTIVRLLLDILGAMRNRFLVLCVEAQYYLRSLLPAYLAVFYKP